MERGGVDGWGKHEMKEKMGENLIVHRKIRGDRVREREKERERERERVYRKDRKSGIKRSIF